MIGEAILSIQEGVKSFGAQPILDGVSLTVHEGDRIGLIGRNGTGKSTLLKVLTGEEPLEAGKVTRKQGLRVALLRQRCALDRSITVDDALTAAAQELYDLRDEYERLMAGLELVESADERHAMSDQLEELHHRLDQAGAWHVEEERKRLSVALNVPPGNRVLGELSGGELRRVDIAATVLRRPDILLLDEPTNHIDVQSVEWIENFLANYAGSCIVVTHDRYFLERVATRIAELEFGKVMTAAGNYEKFLENKAARLEVEARAEANRQTYLKRELEWMRRMPKARGTKQKARIQRAEEWAEQGPPEQHRDVQFVIPEPPRLGKRILEADDISKSYDDKALFRRFSIIMQKRMRVGIIGPNGSGKTTLLRVLTGVEPPDHGRVYISDQVNFMKVDQQHADVDPQSTVLDFVSDGQREIEVNDKKIYVPAFLENFLFDQSVAQMRMEFLSGGEHNRLDLCRKLLKGGNFLVLDEPTNDLDLPTLRVLEEAIVNFDGCAFIVSHDRYFLNRLCTHLVVFEGDGKVAMITGNYNDYLVYRDRTKSRASEASPQAGSKAGGRARGERKLSYHEKRELENMEESILEAEARLESLQDMVNAPEFYEQEQEKIRGGLDELEEARRRVEELYARWEELERLGGNKP